MSLINVNLTDNNVIPDVNDYKNSSLKNVIDNKLIYCDLSGSSITDNSFNLILTLENIDNSVQKCNVLFRNNGLNPIINTLIINNINSNTHSNINILKINNRDLSTSQMTNQEFVIAYNAGTYTTISTIRKYD